MESRERILWQAQINAETIMALCGWSVIDYHGFVTSLGIQVAKEQGSDSKELMGNRGYWAWYKQRLAAAELWFTAELMRWDEARQMYVGYDEGTCETYEVTPGGPDQGKEWALAYAMTIANRMREERIPAELRPLLPFI